MTLSSIVLGLINVAIVVAILVLVGAVSHHQAGPIGAELAPTPSIMIPETLGRRIN